VAITPDGKRILSGSFDKTVRIWHAESRQEVARLKRHTDRIWTVVALSDNARALSSGIDNTLRLWDLASYELLTVIKCGDYGADDVFTSTVNPTGTQVLSGHRSGQLRLWNIETGQCLMTVQGHSSPVSSVKMSPDGRIGISGSKDMTIKGWDLESGTCLWVLEAHQSMVSSVAISPDGTLIASAGLKDLTVRLWDLKTGNCVHVIKGIERDAFWLPYSVVFSPLGSRLLVGNTFHTIYVYRLSGMSATPSVEPKRRNINAEVVALGGESGGTVLERTRLYVNAKVVLLGEGTVGKTSLAYRLVKDQYVVKDRTHGMNVWHLQLPMPFDGTVDREVLLWDLAGQEDYRLIHRLFLDETALALLLINPQKDDPFAEAGDWLKALDTAALNDGTHHKAPRLAIFSQVDVGEPKLGTTKLDRFCQEHGFAGWLTTSAKNGRNCSDTVNGGKPSPLKQLIADSIPWDKLPWTATPRLLAKLKSALLEMRDSKDIRLLRFAEVAQRLEQILPGECFGESDVRTALSLLANHGMVRTLKFGDLVLLQPELLNGYAGAIIRSARAHDDEIGCVLEANIYDSEFDFTGVNRLQHRPDEELLLRAIVQIFLDHSLCIAEDTAQGRQLVFPSQYRREKDIPHEPDIFVSYTFSGEWQTVWTTLVVRLWYSQEFTRRELWRNAAEFESPRKQVLGLQIAKMGDGNASISLYFDQEIPDELKVIFIEYVHRHLTRYAYSVTRDRRYVCPNSKCGSPVRDTDAVRQRLDAQSTYITCQYCDTKVPLIDFIEEHAKSNKVARQALKMDERATRELDTQAQEQILIGHMMAIAGEANQIFRPLTMFDYGIDGEVEFKDNNGKVSGKRIYIQLKSGNSYLRTRKRDGREVFDVKEERHLEYWINQPVDVYLVIRQQDEMSGDITTRWMNVTGYLNARKDRKSRQIIFDGEILDMEAVWRVRDQFFPQFRAV
jgi:hypothetical protein